jgi:two-component sensor histidine kinase
MSAIPLVQPFLSSVARPVDFSELDHREDGGYFLSVRDNGVGLPERFDIARSDTLGLQLVTTLVKQVDGTLDVRRDRGTEFMVTFKADAGTSGVT